MQLSEAKQALCRKLDIEYSDIANNDVFSDADLEDWINQGAYRAWDYRRWEFSEGAKTATLTSTEVSAGYMSQPDAFSTGSIFLVKVNGKEYDKREFASYERIFENDSNDTSKVWTTYKRLIFVNMNVAGSGDSIDIWGKLKFTKLTQATDILPFSPDTDNEEYSGNQAVVLLAYAEALASEKKRNPAQAEREQLKAFAILDTLWDQQSQGRALEQTEDKPLFEVPDMFATGRGGRSSNIGKFGSN